MKQRGTQQKTKDVDDHRILSLVNKNTFKTFGQVKNTLVEIGL